MFSLALIYEFGNSTFLLSHNNDLYFRDRNALYDDDFKYITELKYPLGSFFINEDGLWETFDDVTAPGDLASFCIDIYGNNKIIPALPLLDHSTIKIQKISYFIHCDWENDGLYGYLDGGTIVERNFKGEFYSKIETDGVNLFLTDGSSTLYCVNSDFKLNWKVETDKKCFYKGGVNAHFYYKYGHLLIINQGENDTPERGDFEINAYHADSGDLAWQQIVSKTPDCSHLSGDKVYVIVEELIIILDAATGKVIHQVEHGLNDPEDHYPPANFVYPYENKLLVISPKHGLVQLRSEDAKTVVQQVHVPLPYTVDFHPPVIHDGKVYVSLTHVDSYDNSMKGAVLVLTEDKSAPEYVEAKFESRPPMTIELITNKTGDPVYKVTINHDHLDDVIRFSTIALKETAFKYGSYTSSTDTNKDHHGQLLLQVKAEPLAMDNNKLLEALAVIKERVERNLKETGVNAGDGSSDYVVEIELS